MQELIQGDSFDVHINERFKSIKICSWDSDSLIVRYSEIHELIRLLTDTEDIVKALQ